MLKFTLRCEVAMIDAGKTADGGRQQDPYDMAHFDFHDRFNQTCSLDKLDNGAKDRLLWVFERTVGNAIEKKLLDWETDEEPREFALDRVEEIAQLAAQAATSDVVSEAVMTLAAEKVIYYWQPRCKVLEARRGLLRVFCMDYPE